MKTLHKTIFGLALATTLFIGGSFFADAASMMGGQFDPDVFGNTGVLSISEGNSCSGCANQDNSASVSIPDPGDTDRFTLYLTFRNKGDATIYNAKGKMNISNSNGTMSGTLSGSGASSLTDTAQLNGLPDEYEISFVSGYIENTHGTTDPEYCGEGYNVYDDISESEVLGSGAFIGDLDDVYDGWCDQGFVIATFEVENTGDNDPVPTDLSVQTNNATNVDDDSARLNGQVTGGENATVWFALTTGTNPNCANNSQTYPVSGIFDEGQSFYKDANNLSSDTLYRFRACAQIGSETAQGQVRTFTTTGDIDPDYTYQWETGDWGQCNGGVQYRTVDCVRYPDGQIVADWYCSDQPEPPSSQSCGTDPGNLAVQTLNPDVLGNTSVILNGKVLSGNTNYVFFVLGTINENLNCATSSPRRFPSDFDAPRDAGDTFEREIGGLMSGEHYHYKACAQSPFADQIVSGEYESFIMDDNGGGSTDLPEAETESAHDIEDTSAELNGQIRMNDYDNGIVFYVYGQDENSIQDVEIDYTTYAGVEDDEENDEFMVVLADDNNDTDGWESFPEEVNSLEEDEEYFFRICVEYETISGQDRIECGNVKDFDTDMEDDDDNDEDVEIRTEPPRSVTQSTAEMCGNLIDDGGEDRETWIEFRSENQNSYTSTPERDQGEGEFCERVSGLQANTLYIYRACTNGECASTRTFRTTGQIQQGLAPMAITDLATDIRSNYALLRGTYVANADRATVWFNYGRTQGLGSRTRTYDVAGNYGGFTHSFTNLAPNTTYYYQAAIQTQNGFDEGAIYSFRTSGGGTIIVQPPVVVVDDDDEFDLSSLGLGLSLVRLDIDNDQEVVSEGATVEYVIEWQNISELDLTNLELKITIPPEIQITNYSRGRLDLERNVIYYTIDRLEGADFDDNIPGERGEMTVRGIAGDLDIGNLITAEAELSFDNPVNEAKESALDFDVDEAGFRVAGLTASVFGLANITFLGWLVILLGLFIIFLVARWLYLEREELRAQAYASGYRPYSAPVAPYGAYDQPVGPPAYTDNPRYVPPMSEAPRDHYEPYRPNRGQ